jgi:sterol 3beta-glucosyltransferase
MKVTIFTLGSRGDVQPYVALAKGLTAKGHEAKIIADIGAESLVTAHGLAGCFLRPSLEELTDMSKFRGWRANPYTFSKTFSALQSQLVTEATPAILEAAADSDMFLFTASNASIAFSIAEKLGIPSCEASVIPFEPSGELPSALLPWPDLIPSGRLGRLAQAIALRTGWLGSKSAVNQVRANFGLAPWSWPFGARSKVNGPRIYGYSPNLIPRPADWPPNIVVTGFWYHREDSEWRPPAALQAFLSKGPPPVHVGFGSMKDLEPKRLTDIVVRSLRKAGLRAIVTRGWGGLATPFDTDEIFNLQGAPYEWLFKHVGAIVHHGGSGTTGAVARSGVPSIIVPYLPDQEMWARSLRLRGAAPKAIRRASLSVETLSQALVRVMSDQQMRRKAQELGQLVRAEDGIGVAVRSIETWDAFSKRIRKGPRRRAAS